MRKAAEIAKPVQIKMSTQPAGQAARKSTAREPIAGDVPATKSTLPISQDKLPKKTNEPVKASTSQESDETARSPVLPPPKPGEKKFGLLTRKDLQANKNASLNKRKLAEEFDDEVMDEKRNKTDVSSF